MADHFVYRDQLCSKDRHQVALSGPDLVDVYGIDALLIGKVTLFMALAMVARAFVYGLLDMIFSTRKWLTGIGNIIDLALNVVLDKSTVTIIFVIIFMIGGRYGLLMAYARTLFLLRTRVSRSLSA